MLGNSGTDGSILKQIILNVSNLLGLTASFFKLCILNSFFIFGSLQKRGSNKVLGVKRAFPIHLIFKNKYLQLAHELLLFWASQS